MVHPIAKAKTLALCLLLAAMPACTKKDSAPQNELRLFTWSEYFPDEVIREFEKENNAKVRVDYFSSNEQLLTKLQLSSGNAEEAYDLILPSDFIVKTMAEMKLLKELDHASMPFLADFDPKAKPDYDPAMKYSVPMAIGTTGVAINTKLLPRFLKDAKNGITWKEILESPEFKGKVTLLDDTKEVLQLGLLMNGKNIINATEADVKTAFAYLKAHKAQLKGFTTETRPVIEADECAICMVYSGDALSVGKTKPEIIFLMPKDGATIWADNFAIPANARNPALAYKFMAKVLSPEGGQRFTERTGYRTPNTKARALLSKEVAANASIFPALNPKQFHYLVERKDLALLSDKEWALLKSL
ncbi:MAG: spermidine/putrescine ABC transporter substrate-binding protein [Bacteriovoracia bacterium]